MLYDPHPEIITAMVNGDTTSRAHVQGIAWQSILDVSIHGEVPIEIVLYYSRYQNKVFNVHSTMLNSLLVSYFVPQVSIL